MRKVTPKLKPKELIFYFRSLYRFRDIRPAKNLTEHIRRQQTRTTTRPSSLKRSTTKILKAAVYKERVFSQKRFLIFIASPATGRLRTFFIGVYAYSANMGTVTIFFSHIINRDCPHFCPRFQRRRNSCPAKRDVPLNFS